MATSDATEPRYWLIDNPHRDEPSLPEPASARGGAGPYLVPIVDEVYGGVIAWANTCEQAERIVAALAAVETARAGWEEHTRQVAAFLGERGGRDGV
jgi:hypothetical protein